jgi:hypothetical protein
LANRPVLAAVFNTASSEFEPSPPFIEVALTNLSIDKSNDQFGAETATAVMTELQQMHQKGVWQAVSYEELTSVQKSRVISSLLFLKRKRDGRLKARLVADGRMQLRDPADNHSSPTVAIHHLYAVAAISAQENRKVVTIDIEGAYLNANMDNTVIMAIRGQIATVLEFMYPESYERYSHNGVIYVKLLKALYGTIEAARLWYLTLSNHLSTIGYKSNPYEQCMFTKGKGEDSVMITIYVDDLMIASKSEDAIKEVIRSLEVKFKRVNMMDSIKIDYLGMIFDFGVPGVVKITMPGTIDELLRLIGTEVHERAKTPATSELFEVLDDGTYLEGKAKARFHSAAALALYLAKRSRPDILLAVTYLCTKVVKPSFSDLAKLKRVGAYLNATKDLPLVLGSGIVKSVELYVDASYGVHVDGKSHTGAILTLGRGTILAFSSKQTIVTKSSSEAELVGLSDMLSPAIALRFFLLELGYDVPPVKVYQDNRSTIIMAHKGRPTGRRTRHIPIRYFFVKDKIDLKEVEVVNKGTAEMLADYCTKPQQGTLFTYMRDQILGIT